MRVKYLKAHNARRNWSNRGHHSNRKPVLPFYNNNNKMQSSSGKGDNVLNTHYFADLNSGKVFRVSNERRNVLLYNGVSKSRFVLRFVSILLFDVISNILRRYR